MISDSDSPKAKGSLGLRRPKQSDTSREEFLSAAISMFSEKGYHLASVDEIVAKAGRSKGGFYHHFPSKDHLYVEMFDQILSRADELLKEGLRSGDRVRDILMRMIADTRHLMVDKQMKASVEFFLVALRNPSAKKAFEYLHHKSVSIFAELFQKAIDRGEFHNGFSAHDISELIFSSSRGIVIISTILDDGLLPERMQKFVDLQLRALEK
jgi:AcrR family transcriptional regulator